jgi:predicted ferric reductase
VTTKPISRTLRLAGRIFAPAVFGIGLIVILFYWTTTSGSTITVSTGPALIALGSLAGLIGAYLALSQILLQSRLPLLEEPFGRAGLVAAHRINGYAIIIILYTHFSLVTLGYAISNQVSIIKQYLSFLTSFPYVWWGSLSLLFLTGIVGISITIVRRKLKYETWFYVHLITYAAILLAFSHQLAVGVDFSGQGASGFRNFWWGLYIFTFASVILFRIGRPLWRLYRFRTRVERVVAEADGITSIYVTGRQLDRMSYVAGQFMIWRFLDRQRIWQSHPFTISQAPNGTSLRLTYKAVGDYTLALSKVKRGTLVLLDGPYGNFTTQDENVAAKILLLAGGIGVTPLRSMLEALPPTQSATLIYATRRKSEFALNKELDVMARRSSVKVVYLTSEDRSAGIQYGIMDTKTLKRLVPDLIHHHVYLCGPKPMMSAVIDNLIAAGVPRHAIHTEAFAF